LIATTLPELGEKRELSTTTAVPVVWIGKTRLSLFETRARDRIARASIPLRAEAAHNHHQEERVIRENRMSEATVLSSIRRAATIHGIATVLEAERVTVPKR
jgi:hypothetical protein